MTHNRLSAKTMMLTYQSVFYVSFMLLVVAIASCKKTDPATPDPVKTRTQIVREMTEDQQNILLASIGEQVRELTRGAYGDNQRCHLLQNYKDGSPRSSL